MYTGVDAILSVVWLGGSGGFVEGGVGVGVAVSKGASELVGGGAAASDEDGKVVLATYAEADEPWSGLTASEGAEVPGV